MFSQSMEFGRRPLGVILILIWAAGIGAFAQQPLSPADLKSLLAQIRDKQAGAPDVEADFREEKTLHLMNKPITSVGHVWFELPNKFRREVRGNSPSVTVSNGRELWIYYPNFKSAEHYLLGKHSPIDAAITGINTLLSLQNVEKSFQVAAAKSSYRLSAATRSAFGHAETTDPKLQCATERRSPRFPDGDDSAKWRSDRHNLFEP